MNTWQWKRISRKQSARWQHLSLLKPSAFFSLQKNCKLFKNATSSAWDWQCHLLGNRALWNKYYNCYHFNSLFLSLSLSLVPTRTQTSHPLHTLSPSLSHTHTHTHTQSYTNRHFSLSTKQIKSFSSFIIVLGI